MEIEVSVPQIPAYPDCGDNRSSIRSRWQYLAASKTDRCLVRLGHMTLDGGKGDFHPDISGGLGGAEI